MPIKRSFSTKNILSSKIYLSSEAGLLNLNPWFVTGFIDGEGSFGIQIIKTSDDKWSVKPLFQIGLHKKDEDLLKRVKNYFGVGNIYNDGSQSIKFHVKSIKELVTIINHLDKYSLITKKQADYLIFREVIMMMQNKEHLTPEGLEKIVAHRASLNLGLSDKLRAAFPETIPVTRPEVEFRNIPDPFWLAGFASGEGCFRVRVGKTTTKIGFRVQLEFILTQHSKDKQLMISLIAYFDCGTYIERNEGLAGDFCVTKFSDIK